MAKQRQRLDTFDVAEFLRPTDDDLKSALSSLLRDGNSFDSSQPADLNSPTENTSEPLSLVNLPPATVETQTESASLPEPTARASAAAELVVSASNDHTQIAEPPQIKNYPRTKPVSRAMVPAEASFDLSLYLKRARAAYRLNRTELVLYEMFLKWTHAIGETRCEATNRKICEESGMIEKTVRRNLKSLRERGLLHLVKVYDPYTHEPAIYDVSLPALGSV